MRKVSLKVFFSTFIAISLAGLIPNLIQHFLGDGIERDPERFERLAIVFAIVSLLIVITFFNYFMNKIIVSRLRKLNSATKEVMKGNYDVQIEDHMNDEISEVTSNFNSMVQELNSTEYLNKEFIRNFSHELKTPLSAIKGYADLIHDMDLTKQEEKEYLEIISKETKRLSELSRNMLLISLVDSQTIISKNDQFNITEQIRNVIQLTQLSWESKELDLNLELDEITASSNKELLYQVWMNLFSNAIKFTDEKKEITISLKQTENNILFSISNESPISLEDINRVFDLFFVSEETRNKQSSGVGLTLTKKIITKLDGTITVEKIENNIKFTVTLPK